MMDPLKVAFCCPESFPLLVKLCRFSANTQIISTDTCDESVEKENIAKSSQSFQAFGFNPILLLCRFTLELDIQTFDIHKRLQLFKNCAIFDIAESLETFT